MSSLPLPRFIEAASIDEGDVIRATWKVGDVEMTRTGTVGRVIQDGSVKQFISPAGNEIVRVDRHTKIRFTLLKPAPVQKEELFNDSFTNAG